MRELAVSLEGAREAREQERRQVETDRELRVDRVQIEGDIGRRELYLAKTLDIRPRESLSAAEIERRVARVYGLGFFESVAFAVQKGDGDRNVLKIRVREQEPTLVRLGARYDDRVGGVGITGVSVRGLGAPDAVLAGELQFGGILAGEASYFLYGMGGLGAFFRPSVFYDDDFRYLYEDARRIGRFTDRTWGFELAIGNTFRNLGEVTVSYGLRRERFTPDHHDAGGFAGVSENVGSFVLVSRLDTLDRFPYPEAGGMLETGCEFAGRPLGGDASFSRLALAYERFWTPWDRHTLAASLQAGSALGTELPVYEDLLLGGPGSLPGYRREELRGRNLALLTAGYRYRIMGLPLGLGRGIYAKLSFGAGDVWQSLEGTLQEFSPHYGGAVGLGADTVVGPVDLDVGIGGGGRERVYFSAGFPF